MTTSRVDRQTTTDPNAAKKARITAALKNPRDRAKSNRKLARELGVDESTIRRWKSLLFPPPARPRGRSRSGGR